MQTDSGNNLSARDQNTIWHPLTQHQTARAPLPIVRAEREFLYDHKGNRFIDGIASWYTAVYGHGHPQIIKRVKEQMDQMDHIVFTGFTHPPAVQLAEALLEVLPDNQSRIFFNDNGSTAVEAAIKMAIQFFHNKGEKRQTLIALEDGFHGDTFGAMSASGLSIYNGPFEDFFLKVERIPVPNQENISAVKKQIQKLVDKGDCFAFLYEPLVQGAAGMKIHEAIHLDELLGICEQFQVLTIADEVMTGFGKTETLFASQQLQYKPDMICLSKALTAGTMPMSVTSCSARIYEGFLSDQTSKGFFHAHTYSATPWACAAALAGLDLLLKPEIEKKRKWIEAQHHGFVDRMKSHPSFSGLRVKGVILAMELEVPMERYGEMRNRLFDHFMASGVYLRPLGNTIYVLPPYIISEASLNQIYNSIEASAELFR